MQLLKNILVVVVLTALGVGVVLFLIGFQKTPRAGIRVVTLPEASVYIDGNLVGETPYSAVRTSGEIMIKLVPKNTEALLQPFETKVKLTRGVETYITREFGPTEEGSSGAIVTFDKTSGNEGGLIVVTSPDNVQVSIDGAPRGFSPYKSSSISPAQHTIALKAEGWDDYVMPVNTIEGYRLTFFAKLKRNGEDVLGEEEDAAPAPENKTHILILDTPTGFLRVRTTPGTSGSEIAEVKPGEKYLFLEEDPVSGWFKIQYGEPGAGLPDGISGWVSNEYSQKIETPL